MPTPKNKFLDAVWDRISQEREELARYRLAKGKPDDSEELPDEKKKEKALDGGQAAKSR